MLCRVRNRAERGFVFATLQERAMIGNMTFAVVAFSVLVQGSTIAKLFKPDYLKGLLK